MHYTEANATIQNYIGNYLIRIAPMPAKQMLVLGEARDGWVDKDHHAENDALGVLAARVCSARHGHFAYFLGKVAAVLKALRGQARLPPPPRVHLFRRGT